MDNSNRFNAFGGASGGGGGGGGRNFQNGLGTCLFGSLFLYDALTDNRIREIQDQPRHGQERLNRRGPNMDSLRLRTREGRA